MQNETNHLKFKWLGINTQHEHIVYMREDCHICKSEGFESLTRVIVSNGNHSVLASLNTLKSDILQPGEISLSESACNVLSCKETDTLSISHLPSIGSLSVLRSKIYGKTLDQNAYRRLINDIVAGVYSNIELSAFIVACAGNRLTTTEIVYLTQAMIESGEKITWSQPIVVDKHCIGGLPGNRTTPIIVSILSAFGLCMPKTSSRAITSPAGTADTLEVLTPVNLSAHQIKSVVEKENACFVWGGTAQLSPADDVLIRIEKALDIDSEGQLIASVLSKKVAAGSGCVVIDIPVGETAKVRSIEAAEKLKNVMEGVAQAIGLKIKVLITDGTQPVGNGIGPSLEARDVLSVLRNEKNAPNDLRTRALFLAGELLELTGSIEKGKGKQEAQKILNSGKAYEKFISICNAQGGFKEPENAKFQYTVKADKNGIISRIDNRKLAKLAKYSGAPDSKCAGIDFLISLGETIEKGQTLFVIHAESEGEMEYALNFYNAQKELINIETSHYE